MRHPLVQLLLMRLRMLWRMPAVLFWSFGFPLIASLVLAAAFQDRALAPVRVAVADGTGAEALVARLEGTPELQVQRAPPEEARRRLTQGRVHLVLLPGAEPELLVDPGQPEGRSARLLVREVLARAPGAPSPAQLRVTPVSEPGNRYIDFLLPGLLGMVLMSTSIWAMASSVVAMRGGKLLKRLAATPMARGHFVGAFLLARGLFAVVEMTFFCALARLVFGVPMSGSYAAVGAVGLLGAMSFSGLGLLLASRVETEDSATGLFNLSTMPMLFLSGVFFPAQNFPGWMQPVIHALPLTALNGSLRAVMLEGADLLSLGAPLAVLAAWAAGCMVVALRVFRWT
ncbi:ABC transporter permease [Pyxidicoccus caerfyrddinensis]|uniref:ABC transporter permease n=1 Tax=Pyxidicoccus caerfyrddinensis TaxID=2709663 RepID=UPI0013D9B01E|nr:ABC transporter permease [Pyxidicoccus caerfyrddinensis]